MGQHKHNQTAIDAKNGKLPPKPKKLSKREIDRLIYAKCNEVLRKPFEVFATGMSIKEYSSDI